MLLFDLSFTPEYVPDKDEYIFEAHIEIDGYHLPTLIYSSSLPYRVPSSRWIVSIPDSLLDEIADKSVEIKITPKNWRGTLIYVNHSILFGQGVVDEPYRKNYRPY